MNETGATRDDIRVHKFQSLNPQNTSRLKGVECPVVRYVYLSAEMIPSRQHYKRSGFESDGGCSGFGGGASYASPARRKSTLSVLGLTTKMLMLASANAWLSSSPRPRAGGPPSTTAPPSRYFQQRFQRDSAAAIRPVETEKSSGRGMRMKAAGRDSRSAGDAGAEKEDALWLGLDLSTQSLTAAVLRGDGVGGASNEPVVLESISYEVRERCASRSILSPRQG